MNDKTKFILFVICTVVFVGGVITYIVYGNYDSHNSWTEHTISGYIRESHFTNQWPIIELFIILDTGDYVAVNVNPHWTYAQLINYDQNYPVAITYQENKAHEIKVTHMETMS